MNKQTEALKLALEALEETLRTLDDENAKPGGSISDTIWYSEHETLFDYLTTQITAIRSALAEQRSGIKQVIELYDSPEQPEQQESEAVHAAWMAGYTEGEREAIEKQTAHPSKPWVHATTWRGLTEEERNDLEDYCEMIIGKAAFEAIEAKLKEKNT